MTSLRHITASFGPLGWTSFGGPAAHLGYFRQEFVHRRTWLDDADFADLVAMSQFLPGPASSKVGMAIGYQRSGYAGMALSWALFTLPSALLLGAFGLAFDHLEVAGAGWIAGLLAAAVAVVAHAVWGMASKLLRTPWAWAIAVVVTALLLWAGSAWQLPVILVAGALGATVLRGRLGASLADAPSSRLRAVPARVGISALAAYFGLLGLFYLLAEVIGGYFFERLDAFYRSGALVFGGGHAVLPLLESRFVGAGWLGQEEFLAGYSAAQAVPGPMFTFATYLGAVDGGIGGAILGTVAIFLPAVLLTLAALHFWGRWNRLAWLRGAFAAINAAVVGLLAAALVDPIATHGITGWRSGLIALVAFVAIRLGKAPAWAVAAGAAVAGALVL